jgi:hypothetical protein
MAPFNLYRKYHESSDLFIFCGHGAGERMLRDHCKLRKFAACPAALLWGCSSGHLRARGVHDASGECAREGYFVLLFTVCCALCGV